MTSLRLLIILGLFVSSLGAAGPAGPALDGNWKLSFTSAAETEFTLCLLKLESKDGALTARLLAAAPLWGITQVERVSADREHVRFVLKGKSGEHHFEGRLPPSEGKVILGSSSTGQRPKVARLTRVESDVLDRTAFITRPPVPEPFQQIKVLTGRIPELRTKQVLAKEEEEKVRLAEQIAAAEREARAQTPKFFAEILSRHADSPAVFEVGVSLLRTASRDKVAPEQVREWTEALGRAAEPYGPRWQQEVALQAAELLSPQPGYGAAALENARRAAAPLTAQDAVSHQVRVLKALAAAQRRAGDAAGTGQTSERLAPLETILDRDYEVKAPRIKVVPFTDRERKGGRVVVLELFTGTQCPYCEAAYPIFDALRRSCPPDELVLVQYHTHLAGPDPLANPAAESRWTYYEKAFPKQVRYTPATLVNGQIQAAAGHMMHDKKKDPSRDVKRSYNLVSDLVDQLAAAPAVVRLTAAVERQENKIAIRVGVRDLAGPGEAKRLRLVLVEETVRHVGGNGLRFHHWVARAMPGGAGGVALKEKESEHRFTVDLDTLRADLHRHLDDYAAENGTFPNPDRPMDFKNVQVIAFVQDDGSKEILQACSVEVGGAGAKK